MLQIQRTKSQDDASYSSHIAHHFPERVLFTLWIELSIFFSSCGIHKLHLCVVCVWTYLMDSHVSTHPVQIKHTCKQQKKKTEIQGMGVGTTSSRKQIKHYYKLQIRIYQHLSCRKHRFRSIARTRSLRMSIATNTRIWIQDLFSTKILYHY